MRERARRGRALTYRAPVCCLEHPPLTSNHTINHSRTRRSVPLDTNPAMDTDAIGPATDAAWKPETEIFADKEHIARFAMQLTLMQLTRMSLADVIKKAEGQQAGTVYSAIPALQGARPVVDVLVATRDGQTTHVTIERK